MLCYINFECSMMPRYSVLLSTESIIFSVVSSSLKLPIL